MDADGQNQTRLTAPTLNSVKAGAAVLVTGEAEERIEVVSAGAAEARLLDVRRGAPILAIAQPGCGA